MNFEKPKIEKPLYAEKSSEKKEKISRVEDIKNKIEKSTDSLGKFIDEGIKDTVIYLNALDFPTSQSCEGHVDGGVPTPWVAVEALSRPKERFIKEKEIFKNIAKMHKMSLDQIKSAQNMDVYWEAIRMCKENGETDDFKEWRKSNKKLQDRMKSLLDEFYKNRLVKENIKIIVEENAESDFNIRCNMYEGEYNGFIRGHGREMTKEEKERFTLDLEDYRDEMDEFSQFLKKKYFGK